MVALNPFTPGWGESPPVLIGRDAVLEAYATALDPDLDRHRLRRSHLVGPRSTGKTVMLEAIERIAGHNGWHTVSVDAGTRTSGLGERIIRELRKIVERENPPGRRATGGSASVLGVGGSVSWANPAEFDWGDLRSSLEFVTDTFETGLLVTVDEIHEGTRDEIHELGNAFQHLTRKGHRIAIVMAGLPVNAESEPTFLRRSHKPDFDLFVDDTAIRAGLEQTGRLEGWRFEPDALVRAVRHAAGVPYMMQLVGYESVERALQGQRHMITRDDVADAATAAIREYASSVSAKLDVTRGQLRYLVAMAVDDGPSPTGTVAKRLGISAQHANVYRDQLIKADVIEATRRGFVNYTDHWMRAVLRAVPGYDQFAVVESEPTRVGFDATQEPPRSFER
ncbi:hypothetical protein [Ilumatobacter sp.]|uniref:hypothetical protein n=1 Tax=Ilumatobacter sp. TaxID=1967498 RepID=UPI003B52B8B5